MTNRPVVTPAQREAARRGAAKARAARTEIADERAERFGQLRRGGFTHKEACWDMRISTRTGYRYARRLAAMEREGAA